MKADSASLLDQHNSAPQSQRGNYETLYDEAQAENGKLRDQLAECKTLLNSSELDIEGWKLQVDSSRGKIAALERDLEARSNEARRSQDMATKMWEEIERLGQEVQNRDALLVAMQADIEVLKGERQEQDLAVAKLHAAAEDLRVLNERDAAALGALKEYEDRLDYDTSCTLCLERVWKPWVLQCGHVACQTCLLVLFSRALAQHMGRYPTYDMRVADVHPQYRCPECQSEIKRAPIEVHPLKDLAAFIAQLKGETEASPQDSVVALRNTGPVSVHPFSEYFTC